MAESSKPPQRHFKVKTGIQRQSAKQRAAAIQAEALRQANEAQPDSSQPKQDAGRRTGSVQRDQRIRNQNTGGVFSATGAAISSRTRSGHAVSGTEEFVERAENRGALKDVGEGSSNIKADAGAEGHSAAPGKRVSRKLAKSATGKDDVVYVSDDEAEGIEGKAVDIEDIDRISISSGEEDEEDDDLVVSCSRRIKKPPKPFQGLRPVRAARDPQHDENREEALDQVIRKVKGKAKSKADADQGDKMDLDEDDDDIAVTTKQPAPVPDVKVGIPPPASPTKRRRKSSTKDVKPQFETIEERAERERYTSELRKLRDELSPRNIKQPLKTEDSLADPTLNPAQEGRLYLFQFPPLTPMLVNPSLSQPEIKSEPRSDSPTDPQQPSSAPPSTSAAKPADHPQIKKEDGIQITGPQDPPKLLTAANIASVLPAGLAGRLNVHQSGKVKLEWGAAAANQDGATTATATNLEVKWGSEVDFLQDVVLLSSGGEGEGGGSGERKAWALRQVRNKFVVVPDWGRI